MTERRLCAWGWGYEDQQPTADQQQAMAKGIAASLGRGDLTIGKTPKVDDLVLRSPRVTPPSSLAHLVQPRRMTVLCIPMAKPFLIYCALHVGSFLILQMLSRIQKLKLILCRFLTGARSPTLR